MTFTTVQRRMIGALVTAAVVGTAVMAASPAEAAAAGGRDYVCVLSTGQTIAVQAGQKTATTCRGANAIQIYYSTGKFIKTISLTAAGKKATAHFTPGQGCLFASLGGGASIVLSGANVAAVITDSISAGSIVSACVSA